MEQKKSTKETSKKSQADKSTLLKPQDVERGWFLMDATGKTLGRLACEIAKILRGKHRPNYTPHVDSGEGVIVVNAEKIRVTGGKAAQKIYRYYTGHVGGMREVPYRVMLARKPTYILQHAVWGMMPRTRQSRVQIKRLRLFVGGEHNMQAQTPAQANI